MRRLLPAVLAACALLAPAAATAAPTPLAPSIVGGTTAAPGTWPSTVALEDVSHAAGTNGDYYQQICGGTLVTAEWVLTAQHCTVDENNGTPTPVSRLQVLYGSQRLDGTGTRVNITQIVRAPGYSTSNYADDLALLRLATPVPNASTLPVTTPALSGLWAPGTLASVAGWGDLGESAGSYPIDLMELTALPIVSDTDCASVYPGLAVALDVCAGDLANGGIDTCDGDSGGPLVVPDAAGHPVLIGDTSFGDGCARQGVPGVYAEIAGMRGFVDQTLGWTTAASLSAPALTFVGGDTQTATLTSSGTAPLSVSGVALGGAGASAFTVAHDGCTGVVLTAGQTCSVDVRAGTPSADASATLSLTGDGAAGTKSMALSVPGRAATTPADTTTTTTDTTPTTTTTTTTTTTSASPAPAPAASPAPAAPAPATTAKTPTPAAAKLPKVSFSALSGHRLSVTASGAATVTLTFTRSVKRGRKTVTQTLATATVKFTNKSTKTITLKLTAAGKAALAHGHHVKADALLTVTVTGASGDRTGTLTLR